MQLPQFEETFIQSFDGTGLAYHQVRDGVPRDLDVPLLLCNGLGGSFAAWSHQVTHFRDRYDFVSWDYRGLYRSGPPAVPDALSVRDHARDGICVLDDVG